MNTTSIQQNREPIEATNFVEGKQKQNVLNSMNSILADEFAVFTKTLNYHWNVQGERFHSLHKFFGTQYETLLKIMDELAERTRMVGGRPIGSLEEISSKMSLSESTHSTTDSSEMIKDLMFSHREIRDQISDLLNKIDDWSFDQGTEDYLISLLQRHEKMSWMLRSHLH